MKKIYILTAVLALLTLSLNAQVETIPQGLHQQVQKAQLNGFSKTSNASNVSFNDMLRGSIKGMSSILPEGQGQMRAPLRYDATQYYTVGPFEGDNFDFGYGFPYAYDANQDVTITTELQSSEFEDHIGDEIVGFRLALYGNGNRVAKVDEFVVHPATSTSILNGGYSWALKDLTYENPNPGGGSQQQATYNDIVIRPSGNAVNFTRISVVSGNTTITEWVYPTSSLPSTWTASANFTVSAQYGAGYTTGTITIPGNLLTGYENVQVVIEAYGDNANQSITVGTQKPITTSSATYTWDISPSGYSTPTIIEYQTVERYERITSTNQLTSGGQYLIVYEGGSRALNGNLTSFNAANNFINVSITDNTIPANATTDNASFTITTSGSYYNIRSHSGYYIGRTSSQTGFDASTGTAYNNSVTFSGNNVVIRGRSTGTFASNTYYLRYDTSWPGFRYLSNGTQQNIQLYKRVTTVVPVEVQIPESGSVDGNYVNLTTGQWHEFYLDQPVEFQMPTEATSMLMGYEYLQYPSSNTTQVLQPAAFNSQSTGHNHYVHMIQGSSSSSVGDITITSPGGYDVMFYTIEVYDGNTFQLLTSWNSGDAIGGQYNNNNYYSLPSGWSLNGAGYLYQIDLGSSSPIYFGYLSTSNQASITIANSALQGSTNVIVYIVAVGYEEGQTLLVNGESQDVEYLTFTELEWDNVFGVPVEGWYGFSTNPAGDLAVQLIFKPNKTETPVITADTTATSVIITATGNGTVNLTVGNQTASGNGSASITVPRTDVDQYVTATATAQETGKNESDPATEQIGIPKMVTASPTITATPGDAEYTITATGDGTVTLTIGNQTVSGNGSASITVPRTDVDQSITATATAQETGKAVSEPTTETFTVPFLQTAAPVISVSEPDANGNVVVTATGDGTVYLTTSDGQTASGNGSASITLNQQAHDYTVTASAYAQESGKAASVTVTDEVTVPGFFDDSWKLMTGTYSGHQALSFVDSLTNKPIMFADSISAMTFDNRHPDHYDYVIVEEGHDKTSNIESIPVQKTYSTMYGLYTKSEVDGDTHRTLTANKANVSMSYDIKVDELKHMYNYSLYRSKVNSPFDPIDAQTQPISKLVYNPSANNFNEAQSYDVLPTINNAGPSVVKRVDRYFTDAVGEPLDYENYVPVIWTMGSSTGRTDGKNNSYGSDIKRNTLGDVDISIYVEKSNYARVQNGETIYPGVWQYQGQDYTVFTPVITITGTPPAKYVANDGDTIVYEPYMFRAWCLYEHPHDFVRNSSTQLLEDNGEITDQPLLLGTVVTDKDTCTIGGLWEYGMDRLPWAFGAPVSTGPEDLVFAVRFYYRAIVKDSGRPLFRSNRDGEEEYLIVETSDDPDQIPTGIEEIFNNGRVPVSTTYVNSVGMQSDHPFDGLNIVVTRYSDGTTSTVKVMR